VVRGFFVDSGSLLRTFLPLGDSSCIKAGCSTVHRGSRCFITFYICMSISHILSFILALLCHASMLRGYSKVIWP